MTVKTVLRNTPNKDGSHTIRIRVIENRKSRFIATGEKIHKSYWDDKKEIVKDNHPNAKRINARIEALKPLTGTTVSNSDDFLAYWDKFLEDGNGTRSIGDTNKHLTSKSIFVKFMGNQFFFCDLTHDNVKDYRNKLYSHYSNRNTAYSYFKKFRRVVNEAIADEKILNDPFSRLKKIEAQAVESKALSKQQFFEFQKVPVYPGMKKYKDTWLALFYMQGCRIGDLLRLKFKNIEGQEIVYHMYKTKKKMTVQIKEPLYRIILDMNKNRFEDVNYLPIISDEMKLKTYVNQHPDDYIFPYLINGVHNVERIVKSGKLKGEIISAQLAEYKSVCSFTAQINKQLKTISRFIDKPITSHSARHTYATLLKEKTDDIYNIMHMLGHSSVVVTERYLASLPKFELQKLDDKLITELNSVEVDDIVEEIPDDLIDDAELRKIS